MKSNVEPKRKSYAKIFWISVLIIGLGVLAVFIAQSLVAKSIYNDGRFYDGTLLNGYDVSNMSTNDACNYVSTKLQDKRNEIDITLKYGDKVWSWQGKDFEVNANLLPIVEEASKFGRDGTMFDKLSTIKKIKKQGYNISVAYKYVLCGLEDKIAQLSSEINTKAIEPEVTFLTEGKSAFVITDGVNGVEVDSEALLTEIDAKLNEDLQITVEVPVKQVEPQATKSELEANLVLRAKFSTNYASSTADRKSNIKTALANFNGRKVEVGEEVSFNSSTGSRTEANGYKKAHVILNGIYVEGTGGGVCQASTTLYNALIRADIDIVEVNPHSLPASYVPLAFDAMVAEGVSDLRFVNNLSYPIYIRAFGDKTSVNVEIYGEPYKNGVSVEPRAEFIETLPHKGDRIVKDTNGEYSDKVIYVGEYYRVKYPREGYKSRAYLDYYVGGNLVESKLLRDEVYQPQEGIIIEGTEQLGEGMTLPPNDVKVIPPQNSPSSDASAAAKNIKDLVKPEYNP